MTRLACLLALAGVVSAQLTFDSVKCGQLTCRSDEYCSPETNRCAPCVVVCNETHHNYDSGLCAKACQGYLLDLRYQRRNEGGPPVDYSSIQRQAQTALILSAVALAVLLIVIILLCRGNFSWRYIKQKLQPKNRAKTYPGDITHRNPHAEMPKPKPDLKLEIRNPDQKRQQPLNARDLDTRNSQAEKSQGATTPKTISTVLSNRHPAEDTTLDFSYDNMAMNETPPEQIGPSHRF